MLNNMENAINLAINYLNNDINNFHRVILMIDKLGTIKAYSPEKSESELVSFIYELYDRYYDAILCFDKSLNKVYQCDKEFLDNYINQLAYSNGLL